jgi:hypothetical protein
VLKRLLLYFFFFSLEGDATNIIGEQNRESVRSSSLVETRVVGFIIVTGRSGKHLSIDAKAKPPITKRIKVVIASYSFFQAKFSIRYGEIISATKRKEKRGKVVKITLPSTR